MLLLLHALAAPCEDRSSSDDIAELLGRAERAFLERDGEAVHRFSAAARRAVLCARTALPPVDVARLFVVLGLSAFLHQNRDATQRWLEAARAVRPEHPFLDPSLPPQHPLVMLYNGVTSAVPDRRPLPRPREGWILVDGTPSQTYPLGRAWLFQRADPNNRILQTALVLPGQELPSYPRWRTVQLGIALGAWHYGPPVGWMGSFTVKLRLRPTATWELDAGLTSNSYLQGWLPSAHLGVHHLWRREPFALNAGLAIDTAFHPTVIRPRFGPVLGLRARGPLPLEVQIMPTVGQRHDSPRPAIFTRFQVGIALPQ